MKDKEIHHLLIRYGLVLLLSIPNFLLFYLVFTPLTVYSVYFILSIFFSSFLQGNIIVISNYFIIEIIGACVGISAYYLLLLLNLSTRNIKLSKRLKMIAISFVILLVLNVARIVGLSFLYIHSLPFFDITHKLFWYLFSTLFVVAVWFSEVKFFKIKDIPFYSDLKLIYKEVKK